MPIMRHSHGRAVLSDLQEHLTRMSLQDLVDYEDDLWRWMEALDRRKLRGKSFIERRRSDNVVYQINAIHREVEWRLATGWTDAENS